MTRFYLMRHGQTLFNTLNRIQGWCDSPLTEKGQDQARQVRAYFEKHGLTFDQYYCGSIISVVGKTTVEIIELFECRQKVP